MRRVAAVALVLAFGLTGPAAADSSVAAAFKAGITAYDKGDYSTAIAVFEAVFRQDPRAEVAFTLAQAHRNQYFNDKDITHLHRALGLYRHYLAEEPEGRRGAHARLHLETIEAILATTAAVTVQAPDKKLPTQLLITAEASGARVSVDGGAFVAMPLVLDVTPGTHRVRVEANGYEPAQLDALAVSERLVVVPATLRAQLARVTVRTDDDARITLDGRSIEASTHVTAGHHRLAVSARGRLPVVRELDVEPGASETIDVDLVATQRRRAARWTLYGAAGLAGASLLAGGGAWIAQHDAESIFSRVHEPSDIDEYAAAVDRRDTWRAVSIGLVTTAGLAAIAGAALWYFDVPRPTDEVPIVAPVVGPESVGAAVVGRF